MKTVYILALIFTVAFGIIDIYYINEFQKAYIDFIFNDLYYSYDSYGYDMYSSMSDITFEGALIGMLFIVFYILTYSFTLAKIKRTTAKVMSIIGLSISGLFFLLTLLPLGDPGAINFNEFGPVLFLYILVMLAFCIVNLVQAVRNGKIVIKSNQATIDDID